MDLVREGIRPLRAGRPGRRFRAERVAVALATALAFFTIDAHAGCASGTADCAAALRSEIFAEPQQSGSSSASRSTIDRIAPFARQLLYDAKDVGTAPVRWRAHEWTRFGEGAALVLAAYAADNQITKIVSRQQSPAVNNYLKAVTHLGGGYGMDVAALLAVGGYFKGDETMYDAGIDALESSIFAAGIVTPVIKDVVGRARPYLGEGKHSFHPFTTVNEDNSFPSGHATNAFAIYTAIATRYSDNRYVPAIAYTIATSVAIARVHDRVHFASDVIAGGLIGRAMAKSIVANHRKAHIAVIPTGRGMVADLRF